MITSVIRKVSIGPDYKDAMHFQTGQTVIMGKATIENIIRDPHSLEISVYILSKDEYHLWKSFSKDIPVVIEYDIDLT